MKHDLEQKVICIIGLGYVGLPLAEAFSKGFKVIGFDIDGARVRNLSQGNGNPNLIFTEKPGRIVEADFIIICVPTPLTEDKKPDLSYVQSAATTAGRNMKKGSVVILESSVYPGVTEEILMPILERESGLRCGRDFKIGYSPERINPGDEAHSIDKVTKVVSGMDEETAELLFELYSFVAPKVFKARNIRTAEACKIVENTQRDLNIALMNELSLIFERLGLNTRDVLEAAGTKWNFHHYSPGLVGGYCIPVVPYFLVHKAIESGYHPQLISAGRAVNESMPDHLADMTARALREVGKKIEGSRILIMGLTYKANVAGTNGSAVRGTIKRFREHGATVFGYDPLLYDIEREFGIESVPSLKSGARMDALVLTVVHKAFETITLKELKAAMNAEPILIDVPGFLNREQAIREGFHYYTL